MKIMRVLFFTLYFLMIGACSNQSDELDHHEIVKNELLIIISLIGEPCGEVVEYEIVTEHYYSIECKSADKYKLQVSKEGKIILSKA